MEQGILLKSYGGFYFVWVDGEEYTCAIRGKLRKDPGGIIVGDSVVISLTGDHAGVIEEILPRQNRLLRPKVANIDQSLLVLAGGHPAPDWLLLDKMLVMSMKNQIEPIVCLNKTDLPEAAEYLAYLEIYRKAGFAVFAVSTQTGQGVEAVRERLQGKVTVFAGPSGVGKSSLINGFLANSSQETGEISRKLGRGKHTTRYAQLIPWAEDGFLADTPGFSLLNVNDIKKEELCLYYPEMKEVANQCRFQGCVHENEPDCRVKELVASGEISRERYERYLFLLREIKNKEENLYD